MRCFLAISLLLLSLGAKHAHAQSFFLNRLPLDENINITILGCDKQYLHCYNLYGFEWKSADDSVIGELIVLKSEDTFQHKETVRLKLCRIKEFAIMTAGNCHKIPVEIGLQLEYPGQEEKIFLNFDPDGPDPLFIPCK